jgi:beta-phosphoglucomutase family hydrolase
MNWAVIFDWDGVIINSEDAHAASWERLAAEEGRALPSGHFKRGFGMLNQLIIPELLGWTRDPAQIRRLSERKEALYREIVAQQGIVALPGVTELLAALTAARVPFAVGSSTPRVNIEAVLGRLGLAGTFPVVVSADDVTRGKPDPQVFLLAAERLGVAPARCVVFEDTVVGIEAARAGGMRVVGVAGTNPPERLAAADRIVHRLDELSLKGLAALAIAPRP